MSLDRLLQGRQGNESQWVTRKLASREWLKIPGGGARMGTDGEFQGGGQRAQKVKCGAGRSPERERLMRWRGQVNLNWKQGCRREGQAGCCYPTRERLTQSNIIITEEGLNNSKQPKLETERWLNTLQTQKPTNSRLTVTSVGRKILGESPWLWTCKPKP
jgi:hypothetical protein